MNTAYFLDDGKPQSATRLGARIIEPQERLENAIQLSIRASCERKKPFDFDGRCDSSSFQMDVINPYVGYSQIQHVTIG